MSAPNTIDIARVELLLGELRLPGVKLMWAKLAAQSDKEGWPAARFLAALADIAAGEPPARGRVILRRRLKEGLAVSGRDDAGQLALGFVDIGAESEVYEYGVLVTPIEEEVLALAQLYRDRADSENPFDELKNQWG
jgi:hypothetical protein